MTIRRSPPDQMLVTRDRSLAHNVYMHDASARTLLRDGQGLWQQQVQLSRGHWRRQDAAGATRSAGWWESVTVPPSPAPAPDRHPAMLQRVLETAADMIAPVLADVAVTRPGACCGAGITGCWSRRSCGGSWPLPPGNFLGQTGYREGRVRGHARCDGLRFGSTGPRQAVSQASAPRTVGASRTSVLSAVCEGLPRSRVWPSWRRR